MAWETLEAVLFHFPIGLIGAPPIVRHPINGCHHAGSMTASLTMDIYGLTGRITHQLQESDDCGIRGLVRGCEWNSIKLHSLVFDHGPLVRASVGGQVDYGFDAKFGQVREAAYIGLGATIVGVADSAKIINMDARKGRGASTLCKKRSGQGERNYQRSGTFYLHHSKDPEHDQVKKDVHNMVIAS
jgi:hypothetical protein